MTARTQGARTSPPRCRPRNPLLRHPPPRRRTPPGTEAAETGCPAPRVRGGRGETRARNGEPWVIPRAYTVEGGERDVTERGPAAPRTIPRIISRIGGDHRMSERRRFRQLFPAADSGTVGHGTEQIHRPIQPQVAVSQPEAAPTSHDGGVGKPRGGHYGGDAGDNGGGEPVGHPSPSNSLPQAAPEGIGNPPRAVGTPPGSGRGNCMRRSAACPCTPTPTTTDRRLSERWGRYRARQGAVAAR